jgi:pyridoxamine 5'-phosphate oxidase-like protein
MPTWQEFAATAPGLAEFAFERLNRRQAYLATLKPDGGPRVHPVSPFVGSGHLYVYMAPTSPKVRDLGRDGRYALHGTVENNDGGGGELSLSGRARLITDGIGREAAFEAARAAGYTPQAQYVVFELEIDRVLATTYPGDQIQRRRWPAKTTDSP